MAVYGDIVKIELLISRIHILRLNKSQNGLPQTCLISSDWMESDSVSIKLHEMDRFESETWSDLQQMTKIGHKSVL